MPLLTRDSRKRTGPDGDSFALRRSTLLCLVVLATMYPPTNGVAFVCLVTIATLGLMNSQFYPFLVGRRGLPFMLATIPFHRVYRSRKVSR